MRKALPTIMSLMMAAASPALAEPAPAAPTERAQPPGFYRFLLGDFAVTALLDGTVTLPLDKVMLGIDPAERDRLLWAGFRTSPTEVSINAYLVDTGQQLILVDTGAGSFFGARGGGQLVSNLRASGYRPEDVDVVLITHMHGDHLAGLVAAGQIAFPNAVVRAQRREIEFWNNPANETKVPADWREWFRRSLGILKLYGDAGKLKAVDGAETLVPGVRSEPAFGHTPGHGIYIFESQGQRLVVGADLAHVAEVQFPRPQAHIAFDLDPAAAIKQRERFLAGAAATRSLVAMSHFSFPGIGYVRAGANGTYEWVPIFYSAAGRQNRPYATPSRKGRPE